MDRRERYENLNEALLSSLRGFQADLWTCLPGIIQSYDATKRTCEVQPTVMANVTDPVTGSVAPVNLPLLLDCPVQFPGGGGITLTFPLAKGDECLVIFASRCIDGWWQNGTVSQQTLIRMHDLSDGFVIPQIRSVPNVESSISTTTAQLRSADGTVLVELDAVNKVVNVTAPTINMGAHGQTLQKLVTETFMTLFNAHTHTSAVSGSPTSVPLVPMTSAELTSTVNGG